MTADRLLGAVLAGGDSRRFGRDKAAEVIGGKPLAVRAAATLATVFEQVVIVSSREPVAPGWRHVPDLRSGLGPLAGIEAALTHAEALDLDGAFVLACDMPLVDAASVRRLLESIGTSPACAPVRAGDPGFEPLCAVYRVSCLESISEALGEGALAVHRAFTRLGGRTVTVSDDRFVNVNSTEDAKRAEAALGARDRGRGR